MPYLSRSIIGFLNFETHVDDHDIYTTVTVTHSSTGSKAVGTAKRWAGDPVDRETGVALATGRALAELSILISDWAETRSHLNGPTRDIAVAAVAGYGDGVASFAFEPGKITITPVGRS